VFVDLGMSPPSNSFVKPENADSAEATYPLKVFVCEKCFLVQLPEHKSAKEIFSDDYVYFSSYSKSWLEHSKKYVDLVSKDFGLNSESSVIEIASNDGYLLQYFKEKNIHVLGIEPTANTAEVARSKGIETRVDFFGVPLAKEIAASNRFADLILGNNVLAHVPDINDFVGGLRLLLKPDGIVTMEFPHLYQLVLNNQFDTIYHEHFSYLSLFTVAAIFERHDMTIFKVDELATHGGSIRIYAKIANCDKWKQHESFERVMKMELAAGVNSLRYYSGFQERTQMVNDQLMMFLNQAKAEHKKVVGYGAAAKGNTLLNYCGIKSGLIDFVVDASPHKQGRLLPGSKLRVTSEKELMAERPDYVLILPWNLKTEISDQLSYVREWDGKFVVAIPELTIF
jgi:SAM-dependent methyltransferase